MALREARRQADLTQAEAAERLYWSPSKLLRIENGKNSISVTDLMALLDLYKVADRQQVEQLITLARGARKEQSKTEFRDLVSGQFLTYLNYESAASHIAHYETVLIPGLLQTEEYARTVIAALSSDEDSVEVIDKRVQLRLDRQEALLQDGGPQMHFIMDEAAVRRHVGGAAVMIRQLEHLKELGRNPNVTIQILPFTVGAHAGMKGPSLILEFPDPADDPLLYIENARGDILFREDVEETTKYQEAFLALAKVATAPARLDDVVDRLVTQIRQEASGSPEPAPV